MHYQLTLRKRKRPSEKQSFTRRRNFNKMRIKGCIATLWNISNSKETCYEEQIACEKILNHLLVIVSQWDKNNKEAWDGRNEIETVVLKGDGFFKLSAKV